MEKLDRFLQCLFVVDTIVFAGFLIQFFVYYF